MIELEKKIGFWKNDSNTEEGRKEVEAAQGSITDEERKAIVSYIESSKMSVGYMGWANCRVCGERLGALDMRTPDNNFVFPERYEHYITEHNVRPPEDFIKAAIVWSQTI